ncbi:ribose transport system substrate-binding protein [Evansella caseinilytica]|uniref:Ribose transport system substrate-binding protein n=1 Tax=Evansella caseinilytica TaxID=1503961 RepID=A0A1H3GI40_9BACI|nr:substrate-binding domain-containing protein [Evansella caseinilytica]SDY02973.1 ribose transport system substrate-binding protein [Evansella caseinilytica]
MKQNYVILTVFILGICLSLMFTFHFFLRTLDIEAPTAAGENLPEADYHFVLIVQEAESKYLLELFEGAQDAARERGATIEYWGTKQTNIEDHIKLIEMAIAAKVDGILTQGLSNEFEAVINKALVKQIPVIMVDSDLDDNDDLPYVGTDNYHAGYELGSAVLTETEGETKIGIVTGSILANNLNKRIQGFLEAISEDDRMEVVSIESSNLSKIQGAEKTYQMLKNHPDISIFFGTSALDSLGISEGIKKMNAARQIRVYAFDDLEETVALLKAGEIHAIMKQEPYEMGYTGVHSLIALIQGNDIMKDFYTPAAIIKKEDVEK